MIKLTKICKQCGKIIIKRPTEGILYWKTKKFCSRICFHNFRIGYKHSEEAKQKMRGGIPWNKGKKMTNEYRLKASIGHKGQIAWNKTLTREIHFLIRDSIENINWKKEILRRDNYTCQECKKRGGRLHAHHIKPFSFILKEFLQQYSQFSPIEDKETLLRLSFTYEPFWDLSNGITFCKECHYIKKGVIYSLSM